MTTFEPTPVWLRQAAAEARAASGKRSVGLSSEMLEQLASRLEAAIAVETCATEYMTQTGRDGSAAALAKSRLYELTGVPRP